jgi:hypothetical protein
MGRVLLQLVVPLVPTVDSLPCGLRLGPAAAATIQLGREVVDSSSTATGPR